MTIIIKHRWNDSTLFTSETATHLGRAVLEAVAAKAVLRGADLRDAVLRDADLRGSDLRGADLRGSDLRDADLRGSDLRGSDLRDADLRDAVLSGSDLRDADLRDAVLSGARGECKIDIRQLTGESTPVPKIENIHQTVFKAVTQDGHTLDMSHWHTCETTHCRAGWVVHLAGEAGKELERKIGPAAAAMRIYLESDPNIDRLPKWHATNTDAMTDIKRQAEREAAAQV